MSRGNLKFAEFGFKKGDGRGGRPKGVPNKTTRVLKDAIILAAEKWQVSAKNEGGGPVNRININMPVAEMVGTVEQRIKAAYMPQLASPPLIGQD